MSANAGSAARIAVIEDAEAIRIAVESALRDAGYAVRGRPDGTGFEELLDTFRPDLVLLDLMLPGGRDGFTLLDVVRARGDIGVIVLTARDGVHDRLHGLRSGADDYVVKPFELAEVVARVAAVLRRSRGAQRTIEVDDLVVDLDAGAVRRADVTLDLTATELRLLGYFSANLGRVLSKTRILTSVWGYEDYDPNLVEVHVSALRRKLEAHGPRLLHTVRGVGYVLRGSEQ
jgi:two-component system OmpR family response regulator